MAAQQPSQDTGKKESNLDAMDCNPGTSIDPIDKGKTISSTNHRYTLLDVRVDDVNVDPSIAGMMDYKKVLLVKLQVENISQNPEENLSVADVDLLNTPPIDERAKQPKGYLPDVMYSKSKYCVSLAGDIDKGLFPTGKKVVGYYVYGLPENRPYDQGLYFAARYMAPEDVNTGKLLKVAGSFKIK